MKKIYAFLIALFSAYQSQAQLTLTKNSHEPAIGDIVKQIEFDSTTALPKAAGLNKTWDFSSLMLSQGATASTRTIVAASTVPSASLYPGATFVEDDGVGNYVFYKSTNSPTQRTETLGFGSSLATFNYTNAMTQMTWPMSYGGSFSDTYAGTFSVFIVSGKVSGSIVTNASGTGTLKLPGGLVFTNVLQITSTITSVTSMTSPTVTTDVSTSINYVYFHASQKNPLISIAYNLGEEPTVSILLNQFVVTGLNDYTSVPGFNLYPNPAKENFTIDLDNTHTENCKVEIYSATGQLVKKQELGSQSTIHEIIDLSELNRGIYLVKTRLGNKSADKRLVIE